MDALPASPVATHQVHARARCKQSIEAAQRSADICGDEALFHRSYRLPGRWPFDPFHLIMEFEANRCDFYRPPALVCCAITGRAFREPEPFVRDAIASILDRCSRRGARRSPCLSVDLGANNGWVSVMLAPHPVSDRQMPCARAHTSDRTPPLSCTRMGCVLPSQMTASMLQLGSLVVSVEPQADFARAIQETAQLNCWRERVEVINAFVCSAASDDACQRPHPSDRVGGWRYGNGPTRPDGWAARAGLPPFVSGMPLGAHMSNEPRTSPIHSVDPPFHVAFMGRATNHLWAHTVRRGFAFERHELRARLRISRAHAIVRPDQNGRGWARGWLVTRDRKARQLTSARGRCSHRGRVALGGCDHG